MVSKDTNLWELIQKEPGAREVLVKHGLHCGECMGATDETLEQAAQAHNLDLAKLLEELNSK